MRVYRQRGVTDGRTADEEQHRHRLLNNETCVTAEAADRPRVQQIQLRWIKNVRVGYVWNKTDGKQLIV